MRKFLAIFLLLGCASTESSSSADTACYQCEIHSISTPSDEAAREQLFAMVGGLQGKWETAGPEGEPSYIVFDVTSAGSIVKETMFPGQPHEMTNMYSLDGNTLMMTHYCGAGNQPRMRARELEDGSLAFEAFAVTDLESPDQTFMGSMTLVFIDEDTIEERWTATTAGKTSEMANFRLKRVEDDREVVGELF
jgi:hypothetical protein